MRGFDETFHKQRFFANRLNGINLKELPEKEKQDLFIKENIYIKTSRKPTKRYLDHCKKNNTLFFALHDINPKIFTEIISDFYNQIYFVDIFHYCKILKSNLRLALSKEHKIEIIENSYKENLKKIHQIDLYFWYCLDNEELGDYGLKDFDDHISSEITDDYLYEYLTKEFARHYHHKLFRDWIYIMEYEAKLNYCKNELLELENGAIKNQKKEQSKYPNVFPSKEKELFFYKFLKTYGCIDDDYNPLNSFRTHCDAYYEAVKNSEHKKKSSLLNRGRIKNKFIEMINQEFNLKITKLSSGYKYESTAQNFIENLFENKRN